MKKNIACPTCKGNGYITVMTGRRGDYCGVMNEPCSECDGTGLNLVDMTNADRIRAMSDEELAAVIICPKENGAQIDACVGQSCMECSLEWLQQPVEVNDNA